MNFETQEKLALSRTIGEQSQLSRTKSPFHFLVMGSSERRLRLITIASFRRENLLRPSGQRGALDSLAPSMSLDATLITSFPVQQHQGSRLIFTLAAVNVLSFFFSLA